MNKRTEITQALCDHAKILLAGGANVIKAAEILGVGTSTIYRMKTAKFSAAQYMANKEEERKDRQKVEMVYDPSILEEYRKENGTTYSGTEEKAEEQLPGQIRMQMQPAEDKAEDQTKMMRFQAAMVDRLIVELDKFNDTLNQILRAMSGI